MSSLPRSSFTATGKWWEATQSETLSEHSSGERDYVDGTSTDLARYIECVKPKSLLRPPSDFYKEINGNKTLDGFPDAQVCPLRGSITRTQWLFTLDFFSYSCAYCLQRPLSVRNMESDEIRDITLCLEHVIPRWKGGFHSFGNVVPACHICNQDKRGLLISDWLPRQICVRVERHIGYLERLWDKIQQTSTEGDLDG